MRNKLMAVLVAVLAMMMVIPAAAMADDAQPRERPEPPASRDTFVTPADRTLPGLVDVPVVTDRPEVRPHDPKPARPSDRLRPHDRPTDRPGDHPSYRRRLVAAGCVAQLDNGTWEWTGACGEDDPPHNIRTLINRLVYSHLWKQLYRLLNWLYG
jgi:hypothetical protein